MTARASLTPDQKRALLGLARRAVEAAAADRPPPDIPLDARLREPQGAFVTLHVRGELRGCIGLIEPLQPLAEAVARCAAGAAVEDPRFPPVSASELPDLMIEISALQEPTDLPDPSVVVLGRHGLIARGGRRRGVLLPQVPVEQGWDVPTYVRETLRKAGLPPQALVRGEATLQAFEAEVFSEEETGPTEPPPGSPPRSPAPHR